MFANSIDVSTTFADPDVPKQILLVDDEPYFRAHAVLTLKKAGFTVHEERSAYRALNVLLERESPLVVYDLLIINLEIATPSVLLLVSRLRESDILIPVLVVTVFIHGRVFHELQEMGNVRILVKPCRAENLVAEVSDMTSHSEPAIKE